MSTLEQPTARMVPAGPDDPSVVARHLADSLLHDGTPTLAYWQEDWYQWTGDHWALTPHAVINSYVWHALENAMYRRPARKLGDPPELVRWAPTTRKVAGVVDALANLPMWRGHGLAPDGDGTAFANGWLDAGMTALSPHHPSRFNTWALPFAYLPRAQCPRWLAFLGQLWPDEPDSVRLLQEWFGYVLSGRTDQEKIAQLVGPPRCGKGTVLRVMMALIGSENACQPSVNSLAGPFGLEPLIGKRLAAIADARWAGPSVPLAVERLLTVSGEDQPTVDRKNRRAWNGKLNTVFMLLSNDMPNFRDDSAALVNRFVTLRFRQSFLGRENHRLTGELLAELPGIYNWAAAGMASLTRRGRLAEPAASLAARVEMERAASPVRAFVDDTCELDPASSADLDELYGRWAKWARANGNREGSKEWLSRALQSAYPLLRSEREGSAREGTRRRVIHGLSLLTETGQRWLIGSP